MLITKEVEVLLNGTNYNHYKNLGYDTSKKVFGHQKIIVDVNDLPITSNYKVKVMCDRKECSKILEIPYFVYTTYVHSDGKYYCEKCKGGNFYSIGQWMIDNNVDIYCWSNKNEISPFEINYQSHIQRWFKCRNHINYHEDYLIAPHEYINSKGCPFCAHKSKKIYFEDSLGYAFPDIYKYWSSKNETTPSDYYPNSGENVWLKCLECDWHDDYFGMINNFMKGHRCPQCGHNNFTKVHIKDSVGTKFPDIFNIWSNKNDISPYEISSGSKKLVWWKCNNEIHPDYLRDFNASMRCEFRCPECSSERKYSFLQGKVKNYINEKGFSLLHEAKCNLMPINPITGYRLYYDNEIVELKLIIEVHGLQHFSCDSHMQISRNKDKDSGIKKFEDLQFRDAYKKQYALDNEYSFLEIPYYTDDKEENWKKLIDDKITEILELENIIQ
jgi:hypothetical protein